MKRLIYAGIGQRITPPNVLQDMTRMSAWLSRTGWHLCTGGADGADSAFARGAPANHRTIYLPWRRYNDLDGSDCLVLSGDRLDECMEIAARNHPAWSRCSPAIKKLHARNVAILLGSDLDRPVDAVVAWTLKGEVVGGTGMGLRIAMSHGIPVLNLANISSREVCQRLLGIRRLH